MEDRDGKKYVLDPYHGDPNNILLLLEHAQAGWNPDDKTEVFFETDDKYSYSEAMSDALGFFTPFIAVMITLFIFRKSDPTSMLKNNLT